MMMLNIFLLQVYRAPETAFVLMRSVSLYPILISFNIPVPSQQVFSHVIKDWHWGRVVDSGPRDPGFIPQPGRLSLWP